jgi:K+-transporting ATPase ATPase C chain
VGYALVGQSFTRDDYFWGRPSAVSYNANGSGGSNKSAGNPDYLSDMKSRIDNFLSRNPSVKRQDIPADLLTASASGLDPDISVESAKIQVDRVARARKITKDRLMVLINEQMESPLLGILGPERVNVLKLNIALDNIQHN